MDPVVGDKVKWSNGRKPLGTVINRFTYNGNRYVVVIGEEDRHGATPMRVCRITEDLIVIR